MLPGQKSSAGEDVDGAGKIVSSQGDRGVHRGEAGANQQNLVLALDVFKRRRRPGVGEITRTLSGFAGKRRIAGWKIAQRQYDFPGFNHFAAAQKDIGKP